MPSVIGWLDQSEEHRRKMREVIDLFREVSALDELGLAAIRDTFSDQLFPGISTIQTRARYFLFVPWIYQSIEADRIKPAKVDSAARHRQAKLVGALVEGGESLGVIGRLAGATLKRPPSSIYWNGLVQYRIHRGNESPTAFAAAAGLHASRSKAYATRESEGIATRAPSVWHPAVPQAPEDFLEATSFELTAGEAEFLRERIAHERPECLLTHLILQGTQLTGRGSLPWLAVNKPNELGDELGECLRFARFFSEVMQGAPLIYNLLLAKRAGERNLNTGSPERIEYFRSQFADWAERTEGQHQAHRAIDRLGFWRLLAGAGSRVPAPTRRFVDAWIDFVLESQATPNGLAQLVDDPGAHTLISEREITLKRGQARLANERALELWGGESGTGQLSYRWSVVPTIINDILAGLGVTGADNAEKVEAHAGA